MNGCCSAFRVIGLWQALTRLSSCFPKPSKFLMDVVVVPSLVPGSPVDLCPVSCDLEVRPSRQSSFRTSSAGVASSLAGGNPPTFIVFSMLRRFYLIFLQHFGGSVLASIAASSLVLEVFRLPFSPFLVCGFLQVQRPLASPGRDVDLFQGRWRGSIEERYERAWQSFRGSFVLSPFH